jgi:hypothetical protein
LGNGSWRDREAAAHLGDTPRLGMWWTSAVVLDLPLSR